PGARSACCAVVRRLTRLALAPSPRSRDTARAMSQQNVEIVRQMFELTLDAAAERYWDADIEYHEDPRWPGASTYRGREAVLRCWKGYTEALGEEDMISVGVDRVLDAG